MFKKTHEQKNTGKCLVESRLTVHGSLILPFLTFAFLSMILICSAIVAAAEDGHPRTYIRMEETEIIGIIEHPEITYIIPKTVIRFNKIPLDRDFTTEATRLTNPVDIENEIRVKTLLTETWNSAQ